MKETARKRLLRRLGQGKYNLVVLATDVLNQNKQTPNSSHRVKPFSVPKQSNKGNKGKTVH